MGNQIQVWDLGTTNLVQTVEWEHPDLKRDCQTKVITLASEVSFYTGKRFYFAGGSECNEARIFDQDFEVQSSIYGMSRSVFSVDISSTGQYKLVAGGDGVIRVLS